MNAVEILNRVKDKCPHPAGSKEWFKWIEDAIGKVEAFNGKWAALQRKRNDLLAKHRKELAALDAEEKKLQGDCDHEYHRGTSDDEPVCKYCGKSKFTAAHYRHT